MVIRIRFHDQGNFVWGISLKHHVLQGILSLSRSRSLLNRTFDDIPRNTFLAGPLQCGPPTEHSE